MKIKQKKSIMGPLISVFIMIMIIAILSGLTFLFVASLKSNAASQATISNSITVVNETVTFTTGGTALSVNATKRNCVATIVTVTNYTTGGVITSGNYSSTGCVVSNITSWIGSDPSKWNVTYTYTYYPYTTAENAVNSTENAGYTVVGYLPLIFLAVIFGALLTLVLKIILPYINLGKSVGGF